MQRNIVLKFQISQQNWSYKEKNILSTDGKGHGYNDTLIPYEIATKFEVV